MKQIAMTLCAVVLSATWALGQTAPSDGFKGLCLRMSRQQISGLASNTQWKITSSSPDRLEMGLSREPDASFPIMAVSGGVTHRVDQADVVLFSNRVESVIIYSPVMEVDAIKPWCVAAVGGLTRRYGSPSESFCKLENIDQGHLMLYANPTMAVCGWGTDFSTVILAIARVESGYKAAIQYSDNALSDAKAKAKSKSDYNAL